MSKGYTPVEFIKEWDYARYTLLYLCGKEVPDEFMDLFDEWLDVTKAVRKLLW